MSAPCQDKCVGQVIGASLSINGIPRSKEDQNAIQKCVPNAIEKARKIAEEEQARKIREGNQVDPSDSQRELGVEQTMAGADSAKQAELIDNGVLCAVSCCCLQNPISGSGAQELKQQCIDSVFKEADKAMNYKSRYKSEIWWNMNKETTGIPTPFMHRDKNDANTTEPSRFPMGRVKKEVEGFTPGLGYLRRTDVVMVSDSNEPPGEGNIDKVIEMKFGGDQRDEKQDKAYTDIAGGIDNYQVYRVGGKPKQKGESQCNCDNPMLPVE